MSEFTRPKAGILVVDGDIATAEKIRKHFVGQGIDTDCATSAEEALGMLDKKKYDIAIIEMSLVGMDGVELLRLIRKDFPMMHCIMLTSNVTLGNVLSCIRHGSDTCVFKPLESLKELEAAVKKAQKSIDDWWKKLESLIQKRK